MARITLQRLVKELNKLKPEPDAEGSNRTTTPAGSPE